MADARVALHLDPSRVISGAQQAAGALARIPGAINQATNATRNLAGRIDGLAARYRVAGRAAEASFRQQAAGAAAASARIQASALRAGQAFGGTFAAGVSGGTPRATAAVRSMATQVDRLLPRSDAQSGPFADLSRSGRAIPQTLAAGVRAGTGTLTSAVRGMASQADRQIDMMARAAVAQGIPSGRIASVVRGAEGALTPEARAAGGFLGPAAARRPAAAAARPPVPAFAAAGAFTARTGADAGGGRAQARAAQQAATRAHLAGLRRVGGEVERVNRSAERVGRLGGIGRMWALGTAASQVRQLGRGLREAAGFTVDIAGERQTAAAELRTVVPDTDPRGRAVLFDAAREMAAGRTAAGQIAGVTESEFMKAAFAAVASGFTPDQAAEMVPQSAILGIAGQITPQQAQVALSDMMSVFGGTAGRMADMLARAQDIGVFPTGAGEMLAAATKASGTAKAAGMSPEDLLSTVVGLSGLGPSFRGATGGQKALMAIREMEAGAMEKLGLRTRRDEAGGLAFVENIRALRAHGATLNEINDAFGKRAGPAIIGLMNRFETLEAGLGSFAGTALDNAKEHTDTYAAAMDRLNARTQLLTAEMGEGAIAARKWGADLATGALDLALGLTERAPGLARGVGFAGQIAGAGAGLAGGALETMVGVHAFSQLLGIERPLGRMFGRLGRGFSVMGRAGGTAFATLGRGAVAMMPAIIGAGGALWAAAAPILPFVAGAAALAGAAYLIIRNWEPISGFFKETWAGMVDSMNQQWNGMFGLFGEFGTVVTFFRDIWDTIAGVFRGGGDELVNEVQGTADKLTAAKADAFGFDATQPGQGSYAGAEFAPSPPAPGTPEAQAATAGAAEGGLNLGQFGLTGEAVNLSGQAIPQTLAAGVTEGGPALGEATGLMLDQMVKPQLPSSDAEVGALSRLTEAGRAIPETMAQGVAQGAAALAGLQLPTPTVEAPGGGAGGVDVTEVLAVLRAQLSVLRNLERWLDPASARTGPDPTRGFDLAGVLLAAEAGR